MERKENKQLVKRKDLLFKQPNANMFKICDTHQVIFLRLPFFRVFYKISCNTNLTAQSGYLIA